MDEQQNVQDSTVAQTSVQQQAPISEATPARFSGFWVRGAASIIDGWIVGMVTMPLSFAIGFAFGMMGMISETHGTIASMFAQILGIILSLGVTWGYHIFMTHTYQATLGKMAVDVRVMSENGDKLSLQNIIIRETVGKILSSITLGIGFIMVAFTKKKQGLHDLLAHSVVVYNHATIGPRRWVVAVVYAIYACIFIGIMAVVALLVGLGIMAASSVGDGTFDLEQEFDGEYMNEPVDDTLMDFSMTDQV